MPSVDSFLKGKRVLVTGGTGSIGSEIVRQVLSLKPAVVRIFSRDETRQAEMAVDLAAGDRARFLIGDVRDRDRLGRALSGVDVVFHAAAMKHVAACEYNPFEAVQTNVVGTQNLVQAAIAEKVSRVVLISTDKAVNPTSTMGASKLMAERIVTNANRWAKKTVFASVRFGNVLGSRGSIAPIVERSVADGRPVKVSDRTMTRFVMTIQDAVGLVLKAGARAQGGEIFILKMSAVQLDALVNVLVKRAARHFRKDMGLVKVEPKQRGRGPGEKVDEELLTLEESARTEETQEFLIVHPSWREVPARAWRRVSPDRYKSNAARPLTKSQIRKLLDRAGV